MRRTLTWLGVLVLAVFMTFSSSGRVIAGDEKPVKTNQAEETNELMPQTVCPVTGEELSRKVYVDYNGKRIYFCSPGCIDEFKKKPKEYVNKMEQSGVTFETAPENVGKKQHELTPGEDRPHDHRHQ